MKSKKLIILLIGILVVPFVSAAIFEDFDFKGVLSTGWGFAKGNWDSSLLWVIVGIFVIGFIVIKFGRGGGVLGRGFFRRKRGEPGWLTTRKDEHEKMFIRKLAREGRIVLDQADLNNRALQVVRNLKDWVKYEEKFRAFAKQLKSKVREIRRVIVRNLKGFENNAKRSHGWRVYLPGGIRKGFINPENVRSRLIQFHRSVAMFLYKRLGNIESFRPFLKNMRGFLDDIIRIEKEVEAEAKEARAIEKKEDEEVRAEERQISKARRLGRLVGRQLERTKAIGRFVKKERRAERKIEKNSEKAEKLAEKIKENIGEQMQALDDMVEVRQIMAKNFYDLEGKAVYDFKGNARRLEKDLKVFKKNIYKDIAKLLSLHRKVGRLERKDVRTIKLQYRLGTKPIRMAA